MRGLNVNDIIANISYSEVAAMVDTYVGEDDFCKKMIPQKVHDVIEGLSSFTVFRKADVWERPNSVAYDILEEECRNARPLIRQRVEQIVGEYKFPQLERDEIMYTIAGCPDGQTFAGEGGKVMDAVEYLKTLNRMCHCRVPQMRVWEST